MSLEAIKEAIRAELKRQSQVPDREFPYFSDSGWPDCSSVCIDGDVNLDELAQAIMKLVRQLYYYPKIQWSDATWTPGLFEVLLRLIVHDRAANQRESLDACLELQMAEDLIREIIKGTDILGAPAKGKP